MPSPITFPLSGPMKFALRVAPWAFYAGELLFDKITDDAPDELVWYRAHWVFTRATPTGTVEDVAICTFDLLNFTDGAIDSTWTTADFTAAETPMLAFWTTLKTIYPDELTFKEIRWYRRQFAEPMTPDKRFADSGPAVRITPVNVAGTHVGKSLPYQVAVSITEKTADPKHWGRWYMPPPTSTGITLTDYGRMSAADATGFANPAGTMLNALWDAQLPLVVPTTQVNKTLVKGWMSVNAVQVDDILDVQRRRRPRTPTQRSVVNVS